jgi:hypothetical protein
MVVVRGPPVGRGGLRCLFVKFEMCFKFCMVVSYMVFAECYVVCIWVLYWCYNDPHGLYTGLYGFCEV